MIGGMLLDCVTVVVMVVPEAWSVSDEIDLQGVRRHFDGEVIVGRDLMVI
jgi:hypothetical protein